MKFYKAFLLLSRGKQIALVVCMAHLFAIFCLLGHHLITRRIRPPRPMVVRTIAPAIKASPNLQVAKQAATPQKQAAAPAPKPKPAVQAKAKPLAPVAKKETPAKPKAIAVTKPAAKKELPVDEEDHFLKEIASSFEAFREESQKPSKGTLTLPSTIQRKPQVSQGEVNVDPTYSEFLIAYLQNALDLPEFGEVKAKIEIDRFGKLVNLEIIDAKSVKNAQFLKAELPQLDFPAGIADSSEVFTITFRNI